MYVRLKTAYPPPKLLAYFLVNCGKILVRSNAVPEGLQF